MKKKAFKYQINVFIDDVLIATAKEVSIERARQCFLSAAENYSDLIGAPEMGLLITLTSIENNEEGSCQS